MLASRFRANVDSFDIESVDLPLIILENEIPKNSEIVQNGSIMKDTNISMLFLNQDTPDNTDSETNSIQTDMELIADKVALNIFRLEKVRPSGNQRYKVTPVFHIFNTDLSGVLLEVFVKENVIVSCT